MALWIDGTQVTIPSFPNGEQHITLAGYPRSGYPHPGSEVLWTWTQDADIFSLKVMGDYFRDLGLIHTMRLTLSYLPYSRMDRVHDQPFTLQSLASIINDLGFATVTLVDPHSDVSTALIHRSRVVFPIETLWSLIATQVHFDGHRDRVVFPDAGAQKRYSHFIPARSLSGFKDRAFETGEITGLQILGDFPTAPWKAVIIDDLSSYGTTFVKTAEAVRAKGASEVYLYVTHAEPAIFRGQVFPSHLINRVFTTDSMWVSPSEIEGAMQALVATDPTIHLNALYTFTLGGII